MKDLISGCRNEPDVPTATTDSDMIRVVEVEYYQGGDRRRDGQDRTKGKKLSGTKEDDNPEAPRPHPSRVNGGRTH